MKFPPSCRSLQEETTNVTILIYLSKTSNGLSKIEKKKIFFGPPQPKHLILMAYGGERHKSTFTPLSDSENRTEQSYFYQELRLFENVTWILHKKGTSAKLRKPEN